MEKLLLTSTMQSSMSAQVTLLSLFWYLPWSRRYLSTAETKADLVAFSGLPPCSSQLELW